MRHRAPSADMPVLRLADLRRALRRFLLIGFLAGTGLPGLAWGIVYVTRGGFCR